MVDDARSAPAPVTTISAAVSNEDTRRRFFAKVQQRPGPCWIWKGAISGRGHGRFWLGGGKVVIAHRFAWAIAHPGADLPKVVSHACDNPLCQNPDHLEASTSRGNRQDWTARRHELGSALRDERGARVRAREIRDAARAGDDVSAAAAVGIPTVDRDQLPLW